MNIATILLVVLLLAGVIFAVRQIRRGGSCSCHNCPGNCHQCGR